MALFTPDTHFVVYMNAKDPIPSQELHSREALAPVFADLNRYATTTHFVGQSTIFSLTGDRATGEAYCLAHHVTIDGDTRRLMVASLRYLDAFVKIDEMRRGVDMHPLAERLGDGAGKGEERALAVGARDMQHRRKLPFGMVQRREQTLDAPERKVDRLRMQFLQPLEQGIARGAAAGRGSPDALRNFRQPLVPLRCRAAD